MDTWSGEGLVDFVFRRVEKVFQCKDGVVGGQRRVVGPA